MLRAVLALALVFGAAGSYVLWPVCVPLTEEQLASFDPPIAQRTDQDFYLNVFQQKEGRWFQCKTRLSRAFFF